MAAAARSSASYLLPLLLLLSAGVATLVDAFCYRGHLSARQEACQWGYEGAEGPAHWGTVCDGQYPACSTGAQQSPVDLLAEDVGSNDGSEGGTVEQVEGADYFLELEWHDQEEAEIFNNGHTIEVEVQAGSTVRVEGLLPEGQEYQLKQFHFHTPSEHAFQGKTYPMEIHFVHATESGSLAVVGILVEEGQIESAFLHALDLSELPADAETPRRTVAIDFALLFEELASFEYVHLHGSLTTPPCSEGVMWFVIKSPMVATTAQLEAFTTILQVNNRPLQSLGNRNQTVNEEGTSSSSSAHFVAPSFVL
ncbi:Carbonic anhydrase [Balamuthia mandrillaris]